MNVLLKRGIIPIINENDTVTVNRLKFGDNDTLSAKVAGLIDADLLTILSDIDGLYDANPRKTPDAALVQEVTEITPEIEASAGDAGSEVGTGGMKSKLDAFKITMASGIKGFLGRADTPGILHEAICGNARGTYFIPNADSHALNHKKQWIAFNSGPEGDIVVHNESKEFIIDRKKACILLVFTTSTAVSATDPSFESLIRKERKSASASSTFPHPSFVNGRRIRIRKQPLPHRLSLTEKRLSVI